MQKKFKLAAIALCYAPLTFAQTTVTQPDEQANNAVINESAFTFTEAQLGEDDNVSQNLTIVTPTATLMPARWGIVSVQQGSNTGPLVQNTTISTSMATP